jgi:metal-sulfur cluster biosynthetic enzyme
MSEESVARIAAVRAALARVSDPELDESVVELGFITSITVDEGAVAVEFRLPTYWCAANFSYLMASDMRDAVAALDWVTSVSVRLDAHMFVDEINNGVAGGQDFIEAFPAEAQMNLQDVRLNFGLKSLQRRQEAFLQHLLAAGHAPSTILSLDIFALNRLSLDSKGAELRRRYLERRGLLPGDTGFVDRDGAAIPAETLQTYLRQIRRVGLNAEFNGALCRGLLAARYNEPQSLPAEPELIDFIRMGPR